MHWNANVCFWTSVPGGRRDKLISSASLLHAVATFENSMSTSQDYYIRLNIQGRNIHHIECVQFLCRCQTLRNDVVNDNIFLAAFSDLLPASLFSSPSRLRIGPRLYTCCTTCFLFFFHPSLWAPFQVTGRAHGQQTKAGPQSSTGRQEAKQRSRTVRLLQNFFCAIPPQRLLTAPL